MNAITQLFYIDALTVVMATLIVFIATSTLAFSSRFLQSDSGQTHFYKHFFPLVVGILLVTAADNMILFVLSWCLANYSLTQLMLPNKDWEAAKQSSLLALKNFGIGATFIICALFISYTVTNDASIQALLSTDIPTMPHLFICTFIVLAAMTQCALWPFHTWLISSLNSPTPASAIMHAGLINGGGFLLARFSPLLISETSILSFIFVIGIFSALYGAAIKMVQSNVKRMLACSTMSQMGFMIAQCGLGLFPTAIAHLFWHGIFKAYLFLSAGSASQEIRNPEDTTPRWNQFVMSMIAGAIGVITFALISSEVGVTLDSSLFILIVVFITCTQFSLSINTSSLKVNFLSSTILTFAIGASYGFSVEIITRALASTPLWHPQPFNIIYILGLFALVVTWLSKVFLLPHQLRHSKWFHKLYVSILNLGEPHETTITAHRNQYKY